MTDEKKSTFLDPFKPNFDTLKEAFGIGQVLLLECKDKTTGSLVAAVCIKVDHDDGTIEMIPFAIMVDERIYEKLLPPNPDGGFLGETTDGPG